jgi:hypothetical protein
MKTQFKTLLLLLMAVPLLLISCAKDGIVDKQDAANTSNETNLKTEMVYCGTPVTASLKQIGLPTSYGNVTIGNDADSLEIIFELTYPGYYINLPKVFVGTQTEFQAIPGAIINPDGTLYFNTNPPNLPPYPGGYTNGGTTWSKKIDLSTLPNDFIVVAYAGIRADGGGGDLIHLFGTTLFKTGGYWINYSKQTCAEPTCETAYAKAESDQLANCFLNIQGVTSDNWGWSNGQIGAGSYSWPIYAGAGQCNIGNGTHVGTLSVNYTPPTATVTYTTFNGYELNATHLYVGNQILPKKNNKYTTAPGQFPYKHENLNGVTYDSFTITGLSGPIYVAAHSEVCGYY